MAKQEADRICVSCRNNDLLKGPYSEEDAPLGLNHAENKEKFILAMGLGYEKPREIVNKYSAGLTLRTAIKTADEAFMAAALLGTLTSDADINAKANFSDVAAYAEKCADTGFDILWEMIDDAEGDEELLERRILQKMDLWYLQYVENDGL